MFLITENKTQIWVIREVGDLGGGVWKGNDYSENTLYKILKKSINIFLIMYRKDFHIF